MLNQDFYVDYKVGDHIGYYDHDAPNCFGAGRVSIYINASWRNEPSVQLSTDKGIIFDMEQIESGEVFHLAHQFYCKSEDLPQWWAFACGYKVQDSYESWKDFCVQCACEGIPRYIASMFFDFITDGNSERYDDIAVEKGDAFDPFIENAIDCENSENEFYHWKLKSISYIL
jgi:hypothetical protein